MKLIAKIIPSKSIFGEKVFHVRLEKPIRHFYHEDIVTRNIGKRPWSEMHWVDENGYVNEVYVK